ncbi:MAG: LysM domain-containing protein [Acidimicrobiales bacterium]
MNLVDQPVPYRPRRTLVGSLLSVLLVAAWLAAGGVLGGGGSEPALTAWAEAPPTKVVTVAAASYVVQPGDTLWTVARRLRPDGDIRPLVDRLARQAKGRPLRAGQRLPLP